MSFQDLGKSSLAPKIRSSPKSNRNRDPPPKEQPNPMAALDQISEALMHHQRDRNVLKEQSLISHSTTVPRYNSPTCLSAFSKLNDEIVQFQKMVNELQRIIECDVMTPEDQWRIRILLQSAQNSDTDLAIEIKHSPWNQKDLTVKASFSKLKRDFERAHNTYQTAVANYHAKQMAEAALLSSTLDPSSTHEQNRERHRPPCRVIIHEKEDFFERTLREREEETAQINAKIHVVNNIYEELGRLVNDQQGKIDLVEDQIRYARANTEVGLDHIEQAGVSMCGIAGTRNIPSKRDEPPQAISMDDLSWKLPFQTFQHDIFEVRDDLVDLVHVSAKKIKTLGRRELFQCGSQTIDDDFSTGVSVEDNRRSMVM